MAQGIAIYISEAPAEHFIAGKLFRIFPSLSNFEDNRNYVVVAFSPRARDHGQSETTVFATEESGKPVTCIDCGAEELSREERVIGPFNVSTALANLRGGYHEVTEAELPALRKEAYQKALAFSSTHMRMRERDSQEYADNNWGLFAAFILDADPARPKLVSVKNSIGWKQMDEDAEERAHDPEYCPFN